jgi:hypothetical protein
VGRVIVSIVNVTGNNSAYYVCHANFLQVTDAVLVIWFADALHIYVMDVAALMIAGLIVNNSILFDLFFMI